MRKTTNYNLSQYDATDRVTRNTFNADNAAVDAALKAIATAAANAQSTANTAKTNAATAQNTANTAKTTAESALTAAQAAAAAGGNCSIEWGTYTGNGAYSRTFTFSGRPILLFLETPYEFLIAFRDSYGAQYFNRGAFYGSAGVVWTDHTVHLVLGFSNKPGDNFSLNDSGSAYRYYALCTGE